MPPHPLPAREKKTPLDTYVKAWVFDDLCRMALEADEPLSVFVSKRLERLVEARNERKRQELFNEAVQTHDPRLYRRLQRSERLMRTVQTPPAL